MNPANCCINCSYVKTPQVRPCRLHTAIHGGAGFTPLHLIQQAQFCKFCTIAIFLLQRAQQLADKQTSRQADTDNAQSTLCCVCGERSHGWRSARIEPRMGSLRDEHIQHRGHNAKRSIQQVTLFNSEPLAYQALAQVLNDFAPNRATNALAEDSHRLFQRRSRPVSLLANDLAGSVIARH